MLVPIIVALITSGFSLIGIVLTVMASSKKTETAIQVSQAVTTQRIDDLAKTVEKIDDTVERIYTIEKTVEVHSEQIKVANHRIEDIEKVISKGVA